MVSIGRFIASPSLGRTPYGLEQSLAKVVILKANTILVPTEARGTKLTARYHVLWLPRQVASALSLRRLLLARRLLTNSPIFLDC
jgi:hypothetical protein